MNSPAQKVDFQKAASSGTKSLIKNSDNPSHKDWQNVYGAILKVAMAVRGENPDFFWAASEMVGPEVEIRTILYGQRVSAFQDIVTGTRDLQRQAKRFVAAMDKAFKTGADDMSPELNADVAQLLTVHRMKNIQPETQASRAPKFEVV